MYLKLSVAGHLTIFLTRTRGPFWSIRPARILWIAVLGTQTIATLIAVYGLFMTPLGWRWAGFVWAYALVWFLVNDRVKLLAYRIIDPVKAESRPQAKSLAKPEPKPEAKDEPKADAKVEPTPEAKAEPTPEAKSTPKPEVKAVPPADLTPQIAKRAYELYEERGSKGGHAVQDWEKAEQEIQKDEAKAEPKPEAKAESKPEAKADTKPEAKAEPKTEIKTEPPAELNLHIVKRVHDLYETLGREDVREVEEWEKAERETRKNEPHK
jgi:H+-transporting ATPase